MIGDPLYRPFAVSASAQAKGLSALPETLAAYAVLRRMNLLEASGKPGEAIEAGRAGMKAVPSLALALGLARRLSAAGNNEQASWVLRGAADSADMTPWNWELLREAAVFLANHQKAAEAIDLYRKLLEADQIPEEARSPWLVEAREVALQAGDTALAAQWKMEIDQDVEKALAPRRP